MPQRYDLDEPAAFVEFGDVGLEAKCSDSPNLRVRSISPLLRPRWGG